MYLGRYMQKLVACFFLTLISTSVSSQTLFDYDPQVLYDTPGGLYEKDSLRTLYVNFHDPNYHVILQNSFFTNPKYRIPASITLGDITVSYTHLTLPTKA